ncbi:hypothetical protein J6S88_05945 [bacterium]|nr:hypothetical protein [bacterium]
MCPLPSEMYSSPYYRDLAAAPMGYPGMYCGDLGTGAGMYGMGMYGMGMYPMGGMYGCYFPPNMWGLRLNNNGPSQDMYVPRKNQNQENKNAINKFLKYLGIAVGTIVVGTFFKGKMIKGAQNAGAHTFWTKLFNIKVPGLGRP